MPDDVVEYPLWDANGLIDATELGLSDELLSDIKSWAEDESFPNANFSRREHRRVGKELIRRLQAQAGPGYRFELHRSSLATRLGERFRKIFVYPFEGPPPDGDSF